MEEQERSRSPSRRTRRVEQVVGRWLRRSRDSISRERKSADGRSGGPSGSGLQNVPIRVTVQIQHDSVLESHGFSVSDQHPLLVRDVMAGGPADRKLVPGDQLLKINNIATDDLSPEQAAEIIRELQDSVTVTVLRHSGPKSSFMTAEKRARLRSNPVKVHFAEEVVVNGHAQGNSLLFLPNVLKVYLENGQTKAFKFEAMTTVKDILLTLKEKLSIRCIGHFALVLEQQYTITRLLLLHEEEIIQKVVQRKDSHDYRCLFRVSFLPRDPLDLLQNDPVAFEYLYLQSVSDVLRERFAVEMKCNTALCLAALHMQERLHSCGQTHRPSVKSITKDWGIENFISPTLLRNMREKDLMKAISYHMKKTQSLLEPRQKVLSAAQARLNYLTQLGDLMSYGGKFFTATMMLQDRDCMVNLLIGARYGVSQVVNHKLNLLSTLMEFSRISRVELMPESEKVSLVKIYVQDIQPVVLLMESVAAKDLSCLVSGYCKLQTDPTQSIFAWAGQPKDQRISAEEGYVSRGCSDPEEASQVDATAVALEDLPFPANDTVAAPASEVENLEKEQGGGNGEEEEIIREETPAPAAAAAAVECAEVGGGQANTRRSNVQVDEDLFLELSDWCHTDSRVDASFSSDSMDALMEDDIVPRDFGRLAKPEGCPPSPADVPAQPEAKVEAVAPWPANVDHQDPSLCFAELSRMADCLPSPPEASEEEEEQVGPGPPPQRDCVIAYGGSSPQRCYSICSDACSSASADGLPKPQPVKAQGAEGQTPPRGSDPALVPAEESTSETCTDTGGVSRMRSPSDGAREEERAGERREVQRETEPEPSAKKCRKRRAFVGTDLMSQVSFPGQERLMDREERVHRSGTEPSDPCILPSDPSLSCPNGKLASSDSRPILSPCNGKRPGKAELLSPELVGTEPPGAAGVKGVETVAGRPPAASTSILMGLRCVDMASRETHSAEGEENQERCCAGSSTESPASHPMPQSDAYVLVTDQGQSEGAITDVLGGTTGAPFTEEHEVTWEEGELGQRSTPHTHFPARGRLSLAETVLPQPPPPPMPSHSSTPNTPSPRRKERNNKEADPQTTPSPFPLDHRKRNSCFALLLRNGISLSYENLLRSEMEALGATNAVGVLGSSAKERSLDLQGCSSTLVGGRLSSSTLRGKIQKLPWYLSRHQEPNHAGGNSGPDDSHSSSGCSETSQGTTEVTEVRKDAKFAEEATGGSTRSEEQSQPTSDTSISLSDSCVKTWVVVSPSAGLKSESLGSPDSSCGSRGPALQSGEEKGSHPAVDCSHLARTAETRHAERACEALGQCELEQPQPWPHPCPSGSVGPGCTSASGLVETQVHREACGCRTVYTNCFSGGPDASGFDEELTVHEFSRRTQGLEGTALPSSFSSPSFPCLSMGTLPHSATSELSPLLPPLATPKGCPAAHPEDALTLLRTRRYRLPGGFASLQRDVEELLALLQGPSWDRGQDACEALFSESGQLLHAEARRLMAGCQQVTRVGQTPEEMLQCLADSFRALVRLACSCLRSFVGEGRRAQALGALRDVAGSYGEFARAAERASGRESCQDLSIKLLARQCTALTTSIFCLTQLFCTITSL
ncbi:hypothetical protein AAFF_G00192030 [Aldrovandia affinis]|uniref:FERM and PDZ domain-containing protein 1 n=1 Tax=Aldrovandia affinis TaxID=143900 RepID=A0AAD7W634_9TELE|nr:hypothetical protein AAFF_G00192030 [Aldrovandia affinis]